MLRYEIQHDEVGPYFIYLDHFIIRPFKDTKLIAMDKVMVKFNERDDPFMTVLNVKHGIREWWFNLGFKDTAMTKDQVKGMRSLYEQKYLQLQR